MVVCLYNDKYILPHPHPPIHNTTQKYPVYIHSKQFNLHTTTTYLRWYNKFRRVFPKKKKGKEGENIIKLYIFRDLVVVVGGGDMWCLLCDGSKTL